MGNKEALIECRTRQVKDVLLAYYVLANGDKRYMVYSCIDMADNYVMLYLDIDANYYWYKKED
ncbi:hypothetical protein [Lactococcus formosensis]|uniref:hypothetical protein n=1 Tax=Lactococcus formosensis TaxID=1281486 RepID=UPI0031FEF9AE